MFDDVFEKPGTFTFSVQAIDRDLNYSLPASLTLTVVLPWYHNGWVLYPSATGIVALALFASVFGYRYYQERQRVAAYQRLAVSELADARRVQMGLMPEAAPEIEGLEVAGRCVSANTVSGDFYDYLQANGQIAIVVGDVTGHGMQGAMNAVMVDGVLRMAAKSHSYELSPATLKSGLPSNRFACQRCFWLKVVKGIRQPDMSGLGKIHHDIHGWIYEYLKQNWISVLPKGRLIETELEIKARSVYGVQL